MESLAKLLSSSRKKERVSVKESLSLHLKEFAIEAPKSYSVRKLLVENYYLVILGDSVMWGQGLREENKFYNLIGIDLVVAGSGYKTLYKKVYAHSGATIGLRDHVRMPAIHGEVPTSYPTITEQVSMFQGVEGAIDLVLLNGGINDVNFRNILNITFPEDELRSMINQFCYEDMKVLLLRARQKFPNANTVVTGYYPILSSDSDFGALDFFLEGFGLPRIDALVPRSVKEAIVERTSLFFNVSNSKIQRAITEVNRDYPNGRSVVFVSPEFHPKNAALASNPWLFGIDNDLSLQDEVAQIRSGACETAEERTNVFLCKRASAGHPNKDGSREFKRVISEELRRLRV